MNDMPTTSNSGAAGYRQQLIYTLDLIIDRERQWLKVIEAQSEESLKSMTDYLAEHIAILSDSLVDYSSAKYLSVSSLSEEDKLSLADCVERSLAAHVRACKNFNNGLVDKGITTIKLQQVFIPQ